MMPGFRVASAIRIRNPDANESLFQARRTWLLKLSFLVLKLPMDLLIVFGTAA